MLRLILWDVDDTLINFPLAEKRSMEQLLSELGVTLSDEMLSRYSVLNRKRWEALERGELTREEVMVGRFADFFRSEGINAEAEAFNLRYQLALGENVVLRDDSLNLLKRLKGRVLQFAVTNGSAIAQNKKLKNSGLISCFDRVFISETVGYEKPDSRFFDAVLSAAPDIPKNEIAIVGDSLTSDILGGNRVGIRCFWYNPDDKPFSSTVYVDGIFKHLREINQYIIA